MMRNRGGFGLVEVIISLVLVGIALSALALTPTMVAYLTKGLIQREQAGSIVNAYLVRYSLVSLDVDQHTFPIAELPAGRLSFDRVSDDEALTVQLTWSGTRPGGNNVLRRTRTVVVSEDSGGGS
ncbi:MAG: type II secretion system GspH family protein [Synergistales bacterium]|nr:type II secretion system GspH family protein [Synergistales bacterium]